MTEHSYVKAVHRRLPPEIKVWKIIDDYHGGVSDALYFGFERRHLFVEWKYAKKLPVRPDTIVARSKLPPLQQEWFEDLGHRGQPVCAIVGCGLPRHYKGVWFDDPTETLEGIGKADFVERLITIDVICQRITDRVLGEQYAKK